MKPGDLITLAAARTWAKPGNPTTNTDDLLTRLISSASRAVNTWVSRASPFAWGPVTEVRNGNGLGALVLRCEPATSIISVDLGNGVVLDEAATGSPPSNGFILDPWTGPGRNQMLTLAGYAFPEGRSNITIRYNAGYRVDDEAQTVPAADANGLYRIEVDRPWLADLGVTLADGTPLTKVAASPATMQYTADDGIYAFNAAQTGEGVLISYSYCPEDVQQVCVEMVGERYKANSRIGEISHGIGSTNNVTVSFSQKDLNEAMKSWLKPYKRVVPI